MIPQEYPHAIINGATHHSTPPIIPRGSFPKEMKKMSQIILNRNATIKEDISLVVNMSTM